jgi:hypothetical protein
MPVVFELFTRQNTGEVMPGQSKGDPMLPERQKQKYEEFFDSTAKNGILDMKTTVMIQLAASFSIGCYP